jgi:hypothetical protein
MRLRRYHEFVSRVPDKPLDTIGLGGDGDEVEAIEAVERHFDVSLDYTGASSWQTVGDVFAALIQVLPEHQRRSSAVWPTFVAILCDETGADAARIVPDTFLLARPLQEVVVRWLIRTFGSAH